MQLKEWGRFALLGLVWGSSFLWIKIAVGNDGHPFLGFAIPPDATVFGPFLLVTFRLLFGLIGLGTIMLVHRPPFPRERRVLLAYLFMGAFNTAVPFTLISWGETRIASGLAAILNGTVPLFTLVLAHVWLHDERLTWARVAGLVVGFAGVVVLVSRDVGPGGLAGSIGGQAAVIAAALSYAVAVTFSRKYLRGQPPVMQSFMTMFVGVLFMAIATPIAEGPIVLPTLPVLWLAVAWLGLLGSCLAYVLFFSLINAWGPTRASLVTYVFPVVGLVLGIALLGEPLDWRLFAGTLLVVGGIVVVNFSTVAQSFSSARKVPAASHPAAAPGPGSRKRDGVRT
jgi:drug/metabolite transporter (DMT)-like permease